ncbi:PGF-pre-PGF domain-containing protein [Candidatus Woesearchaeota archaeon]|nr:PGF-pre-PGF domain-containing protein [Candidatus Woesearchaeota archaeon]
MTQKKNIKNALTMLITFLLIITTAQAATLNCQQTTSASISIPQFSTSNIEIRCTASGGTAANVQITPNINPSSGLTLTNSQTMSTSISDQSSSTAKWTVSGDSPNTYEVSYTISSSATNAWSGADETAVTVTSPAQLTVEYQNPPSAYATGDSLDIKISNIGGTTANNVKIKLNTESTRSFPTSIAAGASASYSWSSTTGYDAADTYTTYVYLGDTLQDSVTTIVSGDDDSDTGETTTPSTTPSGGPSGGPGATILNDEEQNEEETTQEETTQQQKQQIIIDEEEITLENLMPKQEIRKQIENENIDVEEIMLKVKNEISNGKITLRKYSEKTEDSPNFEGETYQYLEINVENIKQEDLETAKIKFKVSKTWLQEKGMIKEDVRLYRYTNQWDELLTTYFNEDENNYYFEAETPGFSYFVIGSITKQETQEQTDLADETEETQNTLFSKIQRNPLPTITIIIVLLVVIGLIVFLVHKKQDTKKEKNTKKHKQEKEHAEKEEHKK